MLLVALKAGEQDSLSPVSPKIAVIQNQRFQLCTVPAAVVMRGSEWNLDHGQKGSKQDHYLICLGNGGGDMPLKA
jgi:hypothetical protein